MKKYVFDDGKRKVFKTIIQLFFLMVLLSVTINGCVKQKNCEGCIEGTLINLEKPIKVTNGTIYAYFIPNDTKSDDKQSKVSISIDNKVPLEYRNKDSLKVCATYEVTKQTLLALYVPSSHFTCIEKVDD